jgi:two-component system CheB/CheR fusion protein
MSSVAFPIIGIGASAGGIDAFHSFFDHLPADCGMAFVVILHLPAHRTSMLTDILARWTPLRVLEAVDGIRVEPNCVYVPPPHVLVSLIDGDIRIETPTQDKDGLFRPIDGFFNSMATALGDRSVGIVLSGTGSDGALGLKAIKESGGLTFAQGSDGTVPQYGQMPAGAIATGAVDLIVSVENMPGHLLQLLKQDGRSAKVLDDEKQVEIARLRICAILRTQLGHDFSGYRSQTFLRRVDRRMTVLRVDTLDGYVERLATDHNEVSLLFRDLLIRVTSFFRDQGTFDTLEREVMPHLFLNKGADASVRIWVPGCATGEEAYSLAILLRERMDTLQAVPRVQIFGTDIDDAAVTTARLGRYPSTLLEGLSDARRDRFFKLLQGTYSVSKEIRDLCTFSPHNLVRDPPFSRMDLVSCRNLLIYMDSELQAKVIPIFHYALVNSGILLLGGAESISQHPKLFRTLDKTARIYQRQNVRSPELQLTLLRSPSHLRELPNHFNREIGMNTQESTDAGRPSAEAANAPDTGVSRLGDSGNAPLQEIEELLDPLPATAQVVERLQSALRVSAEQLRSLEEQHQTALEELRSANEEMHSVNEEMQSTNEELETSKEELQSLNEEMHTVNVRLSEKNEELDQKNSDLRNLFESTEIATVFLDRYLIIRSFTPAIVTLYNLIPSDIGRPLTDIMSRLDYHGIREDIPHVLSTLEPLERRVMRTDKSAHYIMRILPYREPDSTVSGVLVTFVDVSSIVRAETALVQADIAKDVFLATLSHELRNPLAPIRTAAYLLEANNLSGEQLKRAQAIISRQVHHMSSLLDDLLDVSRITRGAFLLKKEYVDLQTVLDAAIEAVQAALEAKRHTFRLERPASVLILEVDTVRITQVINNLLTNAIKYTPSGGLISAGVRVSQDGVVIFVRDNGSGIPAEMQSKVFDMFTQIDSDVKRSEGGLGIGLALSKGLVNLHGGRLEVHSEGSGKGSEFRIMLPRSVIADATAARQDDSEVSAASQPARRILVVDDNVDGAESMRMLLAAHGHEVHLAHSGAKAWEFAKELKPEIVVLDIGLPDIDGYEVAQRIRHEAWGENVLMVAITGWGQADDKRRAIAAGFDHHMTKPVDPDHLERLFIRPPVS